MILMPGEQVILPDTTPKLYAVIVVEFIHEFGNGGPVLYPMTARPGGSGFIAHRKLKIMQLFKRILIPGLDDPEDLPLTMLVRG